MLHGQNGVAPLISITCTRNKRGEGDEGVLEKSQEPNDTDSSLGNGDKKTGGNDDGDKDSDDDCDDDNVDNYDDDDCDDDEDDDGNDDGGDNGRKNDDYADDGDDDDDDDDDGDAAADDDDDDEYDDANDVNDKDSDDGADDDSDNDDDNNRMMTISNKSEPTCQLGPTWSHEIRRMSLMRVIEGRTRCVKKISVSCEI